MRMCDRCTTSYCVTCVQPFTAWGRPVIAPRPPQPRPASQPPPRVHCSQAAVARTVCKCGAVLSKKQSHCRVTLAHRCQDCRHPLEVKEDRTFFYKCVDKGCKAVLCKGCRSRRLGIEDPATAMIPLPPPAPDDARTQEPSDPEELLAAMRQLPRAYPEPAILWVPRNLQDQVGAMLRQLMVSATIHATSPPGDADAELANELLYHACQILVRPLQKPEGLTPMEQITFAAEVRRRMRSARQGAWLPLVEELQEELAGRSGRRAGGGAGEAADADSMPPHVAQAAALRARAGSLRAAAAVLTARERVPPGPSTDEAIKALFYTSERTPEREERFQRAVSVRKIFQSASTSD